MTEPLACPGCGYEAPPEEGPVHAYMVSSAACWRAFNTIMAREYGSAVLMETHYLSVDAFAAQHPGDPDERRAQQSVWIHLAGLHAVLRQGRPPEYRYALLRRLADTRDSWPPPPSHAPFAITAGSLPEVMDEAQHAAAMRDWAEATLRAYETVNPDLAAQLGALG